MSASHAGRSRTRRMPSAVTRAAWLAVRVMASDLDVRLVVLGARDPRLLVRSRRRGEVLLAREAVVAPPAGALRHDHVLRGGAARAGRHRLLRLARGRS